MATGGQTFLGLFELKDLVTVTVSFGALIVSLAGFFQRSAEAKIGLRKQLTDVLGELHKVNVELFKSNDPMTRDKYPENFGRMISDQKRFLVRQAKHLAEQIPRLVSPYENMALAVGFDDIDDIPQAETFFAHALERTSGEFETVIVHRQYARFLFRQGRAGEARSHFQEASRILLGSTDRHLIYQGDTFERWARAEKEFGDRSKVIDLLNQAEGIFEQIGSAGGKRRQMQRLNSLRIEFEDEEEQMRNRTDALLEER